MRKFGLIGFPLSHSFSKKYFSEKFDREAISDASYELYPIESIEIWPSLVQSIGSELKGMNVTIPYKSSIIPYLDSVSEEVFDIGAVNTILFNEGKTKGFNTDIIGFRNSLQEFIPSNIRDALILGNGGSAKAVLYVLQQMRFHSHVVSRKVSPGCWEYKELSASTIAEFPLIINTTPLGMSPEIDHCPPIPYEGIGPGHYLFDLIYNPAKTLFLQKGESQGARIRNGLPMLIGQAEAAWKIWNN
jgi:shikimate dehydrogenase